MEGMEKLVELFRNKSHSDIAKQVKNILTTTPHEIDSKFIKELTQYLIISENETISNLSLEFIQYLLSVKEFELLLGIVPKLRILKSYKYKYLIEASEALGKISYSKKLRVEYIEFLLNKKNYELSEKIIKNSEQKYHKDSLFKIYALNLYHDLANYHLLYNEFNEIRKPLHKKNLKTARKIDEREYVNYLLSLFNEENEKDNYYNLIINELKLHKLHLEIRDNIKNILNKNDWADLLEALIWGKSDISIQTLVLKTLWSVNEFEIANELFLVIEKRTDYDFLNEIKNDNELKRIILDLRDRSKVKNFVDGTDIRLRFDKLDDLLETESRPEKSINVDEIIKEYQQKKNIEYEVSDVHLARMVEENTFSNEIEEICVAALQLGFKKTVSKILEKKFEISQYMRLHSYKFLEQWGEAQIICDEIINNSNSDIVLLKRAIYERGLISIKLNNLNSAKRDVSLLKQLDPSNKDIEKLSNEIKKNE
jgi:hypothetical protein